MADFVAVLRKTIGGLGDTSPEMREKVFDKARATIEAKLKAIDPPPPAAVIDRQRQALEEAIAVVRAEFAGPAEPEAGDALDDILADFDKPAAVAAPPPAPATAPVLSPAPTSAPTAAPTAAPAPRAMPPVTAPPPREARPASVAPDPVLDPVDDAQDSPAPKRTAAAADAFDGPVAADRLAGDAAAPRRRAAAVPAEGRARSRAGLVAGALGLVVLAAAAGGYFWWSGGNGSGPATPAAEPAATTAEEMAPPPPVEQATDQPAARTAPEEAAAAPETPPAQPAAAEPQEKFTQRLMPDGSEVDEGPSGGRPGIGEGTSVAAAVQPAATPAQPPTATPATPEPGENAAAPAESAGQPAAVEPQQPAPAPTQPPAAQQSAAVVVGQKAIFYEERTSAAEGSAEVGSIAWSLVQESPGGDLPPEPAIRAEATIPGKDVQLRMTIRRNGDKTLPASHIVEMIFLTPEGFDGGSIANVSRIAFKDTEQAPGNPLIGIPAKIADGFFLIALSDAPAETSANLALLQRQNWLDIPIVYQSGRRALLSMEKGIPGERVFGEALKAWSEAGSG